MELNIRIQQRLLDELQQKVNRSRISAGRRGVITWMKDQIGSHVEPGEMLVKVADLTSYKVEGTISDIYASRIYQGQEALIRTGNRELKGQIISIQPAVKNGFVSFTVSLEDKSNPLLRPHMQVDLFPVTASKKNVVLLPNEAAFTGAANQFLFVIKNGKAFRKEVTTGLTNYEFVEIVSGIEPGDEVIVSNMKEYERRKSIRIK
jgi:HlyD family secretion protein